MRTGRKVTCGLYLFRPRFDPYKKNPTVVEAERYVSVNDCRRSTASEQARNFDDKNTGPSGILKLKFFQTCGVPASRNHYRRTNQVDVHRQLFFSITPNVLSELLKKPFFTVKYLRISVQTVGSHRPVPGLQLFFYAVPYRTWRVITIGR